MVLIPFFTLQTIYATHRCTYVCSNTPFLAPSLPPSLNTSSSFLRLVCFSFVLWGKVVVMVGYLNIVWHISVLCAILSLIIITTTATTPSFDLVLSAQRHSGGVVCPELNRSIYWSSPNSISLSMPSSSRMSSITSPSSSPMSS